MLLIEITQQHNPRSLRDFIQAECQPYLKHGLPRGVFMYRGMNASHYTQELEEGGSHDWPAMLEWTIAQRRLDRKPKDTARWKHAAADDFFATEFGWKARSQAVFAIGFEPFARLYGQSHVIIPIGNFRVVWSPMVADFTVSIESIQSHEDFEEWIKHFGRKYMETNLDAAIESGNEIMLDCDSYIAIQLPTEKQDLDFLEKVLA